MRPERLAPIPAADATELLKTAGAAFPDHSLALGYWPDPAQRAAALALLGLAGELGAIGTKVGEAPTAALRLAWWRERLAGIEDPEADGPVPAHPALKALAAVAPPSPGLWASAKSLVEAAADDFEEQFPPDTIPRLAGAVAGALATVAGADAERQLLWRHAGENPGTGLAGLRPYTENEAALAAALTTADRPALSGLRRRWIQFRTVARGR